MNARFSAGCLLLGSALLSLACTSAGPEPAGGGALGATRQGLRVEEAVIGPELEAGEPVPFAVPMHASSVALTSDGSGFFVIGPSEGYLRGSRLDAQGDPVGWDWSTLGESNGIGRQTVALGAEHFLVIQEGDELSALLIDRGGQAEGPARSLGLVGPYPKLAWNGQNFGLTWLSFGDEGFGVRFALLDAQGQLLVNESVLQTSFLAEPSSVAAGRSHFLVACMDWEHRALYAFRIGFDGRVEQPPIELARGAGVMGHPAVAANGERFLVTWLAGEAGQLNGVHGALLDETGAVLAPDFEISAPEAWTGAPAVASDGVDFVAIWTADRGAGVFLGSRVSASGDVSAAVAVANLAGFVGVLGTDFDRELEVAWNGSDYLAAMDTQSGPFGALFAADLTPKRSGLTLRHVANNQTGVQAVWDGASYRLSWIDGIVSPWLGPVRATRITASGGRLGPAVLALSGDQPASGQQTASAGNGESLTVFSTEDQSVWYAKSLASGESTPPTLLAADGRGCNPRLASNGQNYLAVYCRPIAGGFDEFGNPEFAAWGTLFDGAAGLLRTFPIATEKNPLIQTMLAISTGYLLALDDGQLRMARLDQAGEVVRMETLPDDTHWLIDGARGASNTLILSYLYDGTIQARFYGDTDWLGDAFALPREVGWGSVAFDGTEYWLGWSPEAGGIRLMNITPGGDIGPVVALAADAWSPNLAGSPNGQVLLSYVKYNRDWSSARAFSRLLSGASATPGGAAGTGAAGSFGGAGAVGGGAGPAAGGGSTGSGGAAAGGSLTAGGDSGGPQAGRFTWPGGVSPLPSCSHAAGSRPGSGAPVSLLAGVALAMSLRVSRRKRGGGDGRGISTRGGGC
jgi:hypothetical protein